MTKREVRMVLSEFFIKELTAILKTDPSLHIINAEICLVKEPDYNRSASFRINVLKRDEELWNI